MFYGEWQKIAGNRWAVSFLIWIFPAAALLVMTGAVLLALFSQDFRTAQLELGINPWNVTLIESWQPVSNEFGRWIIIAFAAFVFAGEYQHGTWKNLITRRSRIRLILNKFLTFSVFVLVAMLLMSIILGIGPGIVAAILGIDYGLGSAGDVMGEFLRDYILQMFVVLTIAFIAACYAAIAAMYTKNVLSSVILGVLLTIAENGLLAFIGLIQWLFNIDLLFIYQFTPTYNLANISSWITSGVGHGVFGDQLPILSLEQSLLIMVVLVAGLISLAVFAFQRQDIMT